MSVRRPGGSVRVALGLLLSGLVTVVVMPLSAAVPPPPPNPTDGDIAAAGAQVQASIGQVGDLINQVATAQAQLQQLDDAVGARREAVNKALVDLQNARAAADVAGAAAAQTQQDLAAAGDRVDTVRKDFDAAARESYMRPGTHSVLTYLSGDAAGSDVALDRSMVMSSVSKSQTQVLDELRRAQLDQANKDSSARAAKEAADSAAAAADAQRIAAIAAVSTAQAAADQQAAKRNDLTTKRDSAQQQLDAARDTVSGLQGQRDAYLAWDRQRQAEEAAARVAAAQAAARVAADRAAAERAAQAGSGQYPHTQLGAGGAHGSKTVPTRPSGSRSDLIETVVDRAMSQLGVTYSWGGGDEEGPTLGIHDGGVADSYGDYNKVGFDCSGLMVYAFAGIGVSLPHYSGYQYQMGTRVPVGDRQRGDMLFWGSNGSEHVALYLGGGQMIEAPESGEVVRVTAVREGGIMPYAVRIVT
ncbi:NlpC/P60 family protein [Nocardia stercoris]|uniref:NlpC/P60 family protein n=1 Tax=Nocardia stercoris TaxID=2483361 RepID=A0A3M2L0T9_9NOCA|nr:NlpC/P60 family protein [Nocardia stercoris]RMI30340.1 NlpC/P60 family protein [Nocardia stercoris]